MPEFTEDHQRTLIRETIKEMFLAVGVDITTPGEIKSVQADFAFVRSARYAMRTVRNGIITAICLAGVSGLGAAIWKAIQAAHAAGLH